MERINRYVPGIIVAVALLAFLGMKSPVSTGGRVIRGDGKGYYAYLPAALIHKDFSYKFIEGIDYLYYQGDPSAWKSFTYDHNGRKVNKFFPGLAIVWLPFFLLGHSFAWLEIFARDGYSLPYQYSILFASLVFLCLGAKWLRKLLILMGAGESVASFITLAVALGTNLLYYAAIEPSMPHVYSFALITGFAYNIYRLFHDYHPKRLRKAVFFFVLALLIRPTNILALLLIPFLAGNWSAIASTARKLMNARFSVAWSALVALALLAVPFALWYKQAGTPFLYSYGPEKFHPFKPHALSILLSFNRGWLVYTPLAIISVAGFAGLFRVSRFRAGILAGFLLIFIYTVSCWWRWSYDSSYGQRVFVDIYLVTGLLLYYLYAYLKTGFRKIILSGVILLLILLNLVQTYQHATGIFPEYTISRTIYKNLFLSLHRKAFVFVPAKAVAGEHTLKNDMEQDYGRVWMNPGSRTPEAFHGGAWSSKVDQRLPYSVGLESRFDSLFTTSNRAVLVKSWILAPKEVKDIILVADIQKDGKSLSYNQFTLDPFVRKNRWTHTEMAVAVPENLPANSTLKVYYYNPSRYYRFYIDDLEIVLLSLKNEPAYLQPDGIARAK